MSDFLSDNVLAQALTASPTLYVFANAAHILSIALLVGAIVPLDLRIIGFFRQNPLAVLGPFLSRSAMTGAVLTILTGAVLFAARPLDYAANPAFLAKMALLAVGLGNALLLHRSAAWRQALTTGHASVPVRLMAGFSLLAWVSALLAGRWIGFV